MKSTQLSFWLLIVIRQCESLDIYWKWLGGSGVANTLQGPADPGGRSGAAYWMEPDRQVVWMFGGEHHVEHEQPGLRNDLWKLDLTSMTWHLVHNGTGSSEDGSPAARQLAAACGVQGAFFLIYGGLAEGESTLGDTWMYNIPDGKWYKLADMRIKLGAKNSTAGQTPGSRGDMAAWCQSDFYLTIFGGFGEDSVLQHDMWRFDMQQLTWVETEMSSKLPEDPDFVKHLWYPGGRSGAITWVSNNGEKLYLFGGNVQHKNVRSKHLITGNSGDIWVYSTQTDKWRYLNGTREACLKPGSYGSLGVASETSHPGCRRRAASWTDTRDNLWIFGGDGVDDSQSSLSVFKHSKLLSDIWHYDTTTYTWTWKGGLSTGDGTGTYGNKGEADKKNLPGSRCEAVTWAFANFFYLYGGVGHDSGHRDGYLNDIWQFNVEKDPSLSGFRADAGVIFGLIFVGFGLVLLVFVFFMCNRKYFRHSGTHDERNVKYKPIINETEQ